MENRIAILGIFVKDRDSVQAVNDLLHHSASYILGRMGLPCRDREVNIISIILDAPKDHIGALAQELAELPGVSVKSMRADF